MKEESQAVLFIMLFISGIFYLVAMTFLYPIEVIQEKRMRHCYKKRHSKQESGWEDCCNKSCLGACNALRERDCLANLEQ